MVGAGREEMDELWRSGQVVCRDVTEIWTYEAWDSLPARAATPRE
jgi:hypothetical protein